MTSNHKNLKLKIQQSTLWYFQSNSILNFSVAHFLNNFLCSKNKDYWNFVWKFFFIMACFESPITIPYLRCNYHAPLKRYYETTYRESYQPPDMIIKERIEVI